MEDNYIGENIRLYRERRKLTQQQLADKVGVSWEMISRYERAASSPLSKIHKIANALEVKESQLLEEHIPQGLGFIDLRVPLFVSIPSPAKFTSSQTNYFYISPEWIVKNYKEVIAIDASLVSSDTNEFNTSGILFISMDPNLTKSKYIITKGYNSLFIKKSNGEKGEDFLGVLLAQEVRYYIPS
jgi:transcriptional regulator with XRE-family HTH domain